MDREIPIARRSVLLFSLGLAWGGGRKMHLSLLPLYTKQHGAVSSEFLTAISVALEKTYLLTTVACKPELYDGVLEGTPLLEYLSLREGRVMGIMSAPLRARSPSYSGLRNVCGNAYTPGELREWPRASVITMYDFRNLEQESAQRHLSVVAIHELGHNLGAWDCKDRSCYMYEEIDLSGRFLPAKFCMSHRDLLWQYLR